MRQVNNPVASAHYRSHALPMPAYVIDLSMVGSEARRCGARQAAVQKRGQQEWARGMAPSAAGGCTNGLAAGCEQALRAEAAAALEAALACERARASAMQQVRRFLRIWAVLHVSRAWYWQTFFIVRKAMGQL